MLELGNINMSFINTNFAIHFIDPGDLGSMKHYVVGQNVLSVNGLLDLSKIACHFECIVLKYDNLKTPTRSKINNL